MKISVENILKNRDVICQIWVDYFTKPIDIIEYRTHTALSINVRYSIDRIINYYDEAIFCRSERESS
jgi:hypothetical protein